MIRAPGVYDIEIGRYHHDAGLCDGPSISASGLKAVADCAAKYWAFSPYNPHRFAKPDTEAFALGRAAHALALGEPDFAKYFIVSPYADFRTKAAQEWRDAQTLTVLKETDFATVRLMTEAQRASEIVMNAFTNGLPEQSLLWKDAETGIWLKSRPDWLPNDPTLAFISDYKTCRTIEPHQLSADSYKFGYHIQAALQFDAVNMVMGVRPLGVAHVVQEKDPPYLCDLRMFTPEAIDYGRLIYRKALRTFANCMSSGKWPAYTDVPQYFETPAWIARQMEEFDDDDNHGSADGGAYSGADYFGAG